MLLFTEDLYVQKKGVSKINYIFNKTMYGKIQTIKNKFKFKIDKVVCIENADPDDFIENIKGLVTKYVTKLTYGYKMCRT